MQSFDVLASRRAQVAIVLAAAAAIAVITAAHVSENLAARGANVSFGSLLFAEGVQWLLWASFVPLVAAVERRVGVSAVGLPRGLLPHLLVAIALFAVVNLVMTPIVASLEPLSGRSWPVVFATRARAKLPEALGTYGLIAGVLWLIALVRDRMEQQTRAARLESELSRARLRALQGQLQPHFLFNTLNMIGGLVRQQRTDAAVTTIAELADLLRHSLHGGDRSEVTVAEELAWLDKYLSIQRLRFGDLLVVRQEIDPAICAALVPRFLLQPLVENALRHGLEGSNDGGTIVVRAMKRDGSTVLEVEDDGAGVPVGAVDGVGLGATRQRLAELYGVEASIELRPARQRGTLVRIVMPFRAFADPP